MGTWTTRLSGVWLGVLLLWGCGDGGLASNTCRLRPDLCSGGAGSFCDRDDDCALSLFCCTEKANCGGGMCTAQCDGDRDCPASMLCEHNMCFYACESDRDCAEDMSCEHGNTVCEYR